jgi:integrase
MSSFDQLAAETLAKVKGFGIKSKSVFKGFRSTCRLLKSYLEENQLEFTFENGQKWLSKIRPCDPITRSQYIIFAGRRRVVSLLLEQQEGNLDTWKMYLQVTAARPQTVGYLNLLDIYEQRLQTDGMVKATISFALRVVSDFLIYLEKVGKICISEVVAQDIIGYFTQDSFSGRKPDGIKAYAYKLRAFLVFLEEADIIVDRKLSLAVPKTFAKQESIVTVLSEKSVNALRNKEYEPDTNTFIRNHAMMLLALRLGIRRSDIHNMKLTDIDWKNDSISFIQQKTNTPITLPLLPDVGNSLMDYILNCRPQGSEDAVFMRYYAPHQALTLNANIIEKCLDNVNPKDYPQRGYHILRRTCATMMLESNVPRSVISASLGQVDPNSVNVYLSADEKNMRKCALSLIGIECTRGELR